MGLGGSSDAGEFARQQEIKRQANVKGALANIDFAFKGFTPAFYAAQEKAYQRLNTPEVLGQHRLAQRQAVSGLNDRGLLSSSLGAEWRTSLNRELAKQMQNVAEGGKAVSQQTRQSVEQQRANLASQAIASADPGSMLSLAQNAAAGLNTPPVFQPLGDVFNAWLARNMAQMYAGNVQQMSQNPNRASFAGPVAKTSFTTKA